MTAKRGRYAAIEGSGEYAGKIFFFIDDVYLRYNVAADRMDQGYPQPMHVWSFPMGFGGCLDAAVNGQGRFDGKAYFFKGARYLRFDWAADRVDDGFPQPLSAWNLPAPFDQGIDAALNGAGEYAGKLFLFRGDRYLRYDWALERVDEGYPQPSSVWAFPEGFGPGLDAAVNGPAEGPYAGKAWFFSRGRYVRYDWAADRVDDGFPAPVSAWGLANPGDGWTLGTLSSRYETGGRGIGTVSTGAGDAGGVSYGSYQMTSLPGGGTVARFVGDPAFPWHDRFAGVTPGTPDFTARWRALAIEAPEEFYDAQHAFVARTHYVPLTARVASDDGIQVPSRHRALQDAVWSTAVQHGPGSAIVHRALQALGAVDRADPQLDRRLISAIYAERGRRDADGSLVYFRANSTAVQAGVARRFTDEERDALRMFDSGP